MQDFTNTLEPGTEPSVSPVLVVALPSGFVLLVIISVIAVLVYIIWRLSHHHGNTPPNRIVVSNSFVIQNSIYSRPMQVQEVGGQSFLYVPHPLKEVVDRSSRTNSSQPSYSDTYSTQYYPPPPMQAHTHTASPQSAQAPQAGPVHVRTKSCHSNPEAILIGNPRCAPEMPKSISCNIALNKSFGVYLTTGVSFSNPSLYSCVTHTPIQVDHISSSPGSGRSSLLISLTSFHSTSSDHDTDLLCHDQPEGHTHYETPV